MIGPAGTGPAKTSVPKGVPSVNEVLIFYTGLIISVKSLPSWLEYRTFVHRFEEIVNVQVQTSA